MLYSHFWLIECVLAGQITGQLVRSLKVFYFSSKEVIGCKIHFSSCLNIMCVGRMCTHPSYNEKNPPSVFLIPVLKSPFSNQAVLIFPAEWRSSVHDSWLTRPSYLRPALSELSSVHHCVDYGAGEDKISPIKRLRCLVVGCNNE